MEAGWLLIDVGLRSTRHDGDDDDGDGAIHAYLNPDGSRAMGR